jgi:hypothetical protein
MFMHYPEKASEWSKIQNLARLSTWQAKLTQKKKNASEHQIKALMYTTSKTSEHNEISASQAEYETISSA